MAQHVLAPHSRVVVIGVGGGGRVEIDLLGIMSRRASVTGSTLRARSRDEKADIAAQMQREVAPLLESGALRVPLAGTFSLTDAAEAYEAFAQPGKFGKFVLLTEAAHR